jgi:hypothetical protein
LRAEGFFVTWTSFFEAWGEVNCSLGYKKITAEKIIIFFIPKYNLPLPRIQKRTSMLQRSLQLSKENIQHFKT